MDQTQTQPAEKPCSVCGKQIEATKLRIHEATCARNNYKCPKCNEIVSKAEKDHHEQEYHTAVPCQYCKEFQAEKSIVNEHQMYCEKKPQQCYFCELLVEGDKFDEHINYCGSKTQKCPDCNQNIPMRESGDHKSSGKCNFFQELEKGKALQDLYKFQEEEQKKLQYKMKETTYNQRVAKEQKYIEEQQRAQNPNAKVINYDDGRTYVKKKTNQLQATPPKKSESKDMIKKQNESPDMHELDVEEANAQLIARLMQEEADAQEAQKFSQNTNQEQFEDSYNNQYAQSNIRNPDQVYEEQLIGGHEPLASGFSSSHHFGGFPGGYTHGFSTHQVITSSNFRPPQVQQQHFQEEFEDVEMTHPEGDEDEMMKRALQESLGGAPQHQESDHLDTEEQILKQILEESKKHQ